MESNLRQQLPPQRIGILQPWVSFQQNRFGGRHFHPKKKISSLFKRVQNPQYQLLMIRRVYILKH